MSEVSEITVILKNDESTVKHKFLCYEPLHNLELLKGFIDEAKAEFKASVDEVRVQTKIVWE